MMNSVGFVLIRKLCYIWKRFGPSQLVIYIWNPLVRNLSVSRILLFCSVDIGVIWFGAEWKVGTFPSSVVFQGWLWESNFFFQKATIVPEKLLLLHFCYSKLMFMSIFESNFSVEKHIILPTLFAGLLFFLRHNPNGCINKSTIWVLYKAN